MDFEKTSAVIRLCGFFGCKFDNRERYTNPTLLLRLSLDCIHNRRYGRLLPGLLRARGLSSVGAEARLFLCQGGSAGIALLRANFEQLRERMIEGNYISQQEFDRDLAQLDDPDVLMPSSILWSVWGRRP
jgi:hypothetical protein